MKKKTAAAVCAALILLSGCGRRNQTAPAPEPTAAPTPAPTAAPTPAPTATPEPTPTPTATPEPTPYWAQLEKEETYLLFTGASVGGKALASWLMAGGAQMTAEFVCQRVDAPLFELTFNPREEKDIPAAGEEARYVRLSTDETVLQSGLLEELLPAFEKKYGYIVEICTGDAENVTDWAGVKTADVALLSENGSKNLNRRGFSNVTAWAVTRYALTAWTDTGGK